MNSPCFATLPLLCIIVNANQREKQKKNGLGTRLTLATFPSDKLEQDQKPRLHNYYTDVSVEASCVWLPHQSQQDIKHALCSLRLERQQ